MQLDSRTLLTTLSVLGLVYSGLLTAVTWRSRAYPGYGRWLCAVLLTVISGFLLALRSNIPDWVSVIVANALLVVASILYVEGARAFRGTPVHNLFTYAGGIVTVGGLAFFLYVVPSLNARGVLMSSFIGIVFLRLSVKLLTAVPPALRLGLRLTGTLFGMFAATNLVRALYFAFGPQVGGLFEMGAVNSALILLVTLEAALFPIGFVLLSDEQAIADLNDAGERARSLQKSLGENERRQALLLRLSDALRPLVDAGEIQFTAARFLGEYLGVNRVAYAEIEGSDYMIRHSWSKGVTPLVGRGPVTYFGAALLDAYRRGETVVVNDVRTEPRFTEWERAALLSNGTAALIRVMLLKAGKWVSVFSTENATPRVWTRAEIDLIRDAAERTWEAVERARTEEALAERERFLRLALDASGAADWRWNVRANQLFWNDRNYEHFGIEPGTSPPFDVWISGVIEEDRQRLLKRLDEILKGEGDEWNMVFRFLRPDGALVWVHGLGRAERDAQGQVTWIRGIGLDVTEQHRAEEALQLSEHKFRLSLQAAHLGTWQYDLNKETFAVDETGKMLHGLAPDGVIEKLEDGGRYLHPDDIPGIQLRFRQAIAERSTFEHEYRVVYPNGETHWVSSLGTVQPGSSSFFGIVQDVTARKRVELELQDRHREQERTLRLLLESAPQGILSVDAAGTIIMANAATETMFGWERGELVGKSVGLLLPPALRDRHAEQRAAYFAKPQARPMGIGRDLVGQRKDSSTFPIEISLSHISTAAGLHAIAFITDITMRKQAEEALRQSHRELERKTLQLRRLASQLTLAEQRAREQLARTLHDGLQQLLFSATVTLNRAVKGDSKADHGELFENLRADLDEAMKAARTLSVDLFPPVLHVGGLPAALAWLAKQTKEQYGLVVNLTADTRANPEANDVRILLFEAVRELLFNAVKHAHVDRVDVDVELLPDDTIHILVSDQGIGFDPAVTSGRMDQYQGGLGLFSIQERLALLGGSLEIDSAPGKGARFSLTLPRSDLPLLNTGSAGAERYELGRRQRRASTPAAHGASKTLRILIADDHVVARAGLRQLFSKRPALQVVGEAANGVEAISQATALQPDVIVMDVSMPHMSGIEATRVILGARPNIRIVGLSTHDDENSERSMRAAGAQAYFTKNEGADRLLDYLLSLSDPAKASTQRL